MPRVRIAHRVQDDYGYEIMTEIPTPASYCPGCNYRFDRATSTFDDQVRPKPGDITICIKCATVLIFNGDMSARLATDGDLRELDAVTLLEIFRARTAIRFIQTRRN